MIEIDGVTKCFKDKKAVDNVTLKINDGDFIGLLGPNGAGKTTLIKMLTALIRPTEGQILIDNQLVSRKNNNVKAKIGVVPQYMNLEKEMKVYEDLVFAARLFKIPKEVYIKRIDYLLEVLELEEFKDKMSQQLSGGTQRKVMIAKALINNPDIIFLDEPTVGIDINARRTIWDILKKMNDKGITILLTTHYIEEAEALCNRVCFIDDGKIFKDDSPENLIKSLGQVTVEEFDKDKGTIYKYFKSQDEAVRYLKERDSKDLLMRQLTLGDVFYNFTNRQVK
ncbi:MAG TPA: ABC transporter ATP-binding protein [Tissierellaceae bacterium]